MKHSTSMKLGGMIFTAVSMVCALVLVASGAIIWHFVSKFWQGMT